MSEEDNDIHLELEERAQVIAEATGRSKESVLEDLLDDGVVNLSNEDKSESLVEQLKEAAELISTVQQINQQVSDNSVLNGGVNKTEVAVETTLEGDIVDRALESVQRKAEKIKVILAVVAPILLLLSGGVGIDYFMSDDVSDESQGSGEEIWDCIPQWYYDEFGYTDDSTLEIRFAFQDNAECNIEHFGGHFIITLFESGEQQDQIFIRNIDFTNGIAIEHTIEDLADGTYHYRVEFHVVECEDGSCEHGDEYYLPSSQQFIIESQEEPEGCDAYLINQQAYLLEDDSEQDAVRISADVDLVDEKENCDGEQFEITWRLYQDGEVKYEENTFEDGKVSDPDGADYTYHTWDGVSVGTYEPTIILRLNGEVLDEKWIAHSIDILEQEIWGCTDSEATNYSPDATDDDGSCEYPPTDPCDVEIHNHYRGHVAEDEEQDAILVAFRVVPSNCEDEMVEIDIELYQNGYDANYSHWLEVNGDNEYTDVSYIFDGVAVGNSWTPRITASLNDEQLEQVLFWGIDVEEQEPETCEIYLFDISLQTNSTHATVAFDLDCGQSANDLDGYNVSVQFLIYPLNDTSQENIVVYDTKLYYIQGYVDDTHTIALTNFSDNNTTHYDIYWYAIWTDADGTQQFIEQKWLNREMEA